MPTTCRLPCCAPASAPTGAPTAPTGDGRRGPHAPGAAGDGAELARRLLDSAVEGTGEQAAVAVLAAHGRWLRHRGFVTSCVRSFGDQAWVRWPVVRRFLVRTPCPEVDHEVLLRACDLAAATGAPAAARPGAVRGG